MKNFTRIITVLALAVLMAPAALAARSHDTALEIVDADLEVKRSRLRGSVEVCNTEAEDVRFTLEAKNLTVNQLYKRNFTVLGGDCQEFNLRFSKNFALMTNADDEVKFVAKKVSSRDTRRRRRGRLVGARPSDYKLSNEYVAEVEQGDKDKAGCGDEEGNDVFEMCPGDFAYHEDTGLRVRLNSIKRNKAEVMVTHVKWGGVKKFTLYRNRGRTVTARNDVSSKFKLNNLAASSHQKLLLKIDPVSRTAR